MASSREIAMHRRSVIAALVAGCATTSGLALEVGHARALGVNISYIRRPGPSSTVVFESGLGDGLEVWSDVIDRLGTNISYFAYSRPGYGESEAGAAQASRSSAQATALLHDLLRVADVRPPYVLVGHSLGGLYIAHYAKEFPNEVSGLVFVDGRPPGFRASCDANGIQFCGSASNETRQPDWPTHIVAELAGITASEDAVASGVVALAGVPATIITSTRAWPGEQGAEAFALWLEQQEAFTRSFRSHRFVRAEGSGHYVQREQPALVARELEALVGSVR
jgi:pimeloyl-ACP methyl ester carboxylesterase